MKYRVKHPFEEDAELDRITSLPDNVLEYILSELPIRDAVRTSILSRRWRYKWSKIPNIVFDNHGVSNASQEQTLATSKLVSIIDHVLLLHNAPVRKFRLSHRDLVGISDIDRWVLCLSRRSVKEFILEIWKGQRYKLPSSLFSYKHLVHLELFNCLLRPPATFNGFRHLKSLDLQHVTMSQDVFESLIARCPLLERLTLMNFDGFSLLTIHAPNLQFFDIGGVFNDVSFENAFQLTLVSIGLYANVRNEPNVAQGRSSKLVRFFLNLPHIRRLEIQSLFLKYLSIGDIPSRLPSPCLDLNYLSIRICFNDLEESLAALCILKSAPNLQELEMLARQEEQPDAVLRNFWVDDHWKCLFGQLRQVKISANNGAKSELEFIDFVLSNAPVLERMTIKPVVMEEGWEFTKEFMKELLRFRRASVQAEIIYVDP